MNFVSQHIKHIVELYESDHCIYYLIIFVISMVLLPGIGSYLGNILYMIQSHLGLVKSESNKVDDNFISYFAEPEFKLNISHRLKYLIRLSRNRKLLSVVAKAYKRTRPDIGIDGLDLSVPYLELSGDSLKISMTTKNCFVFLFALLSVITTCLFSSLMIVLIFTYYNPHHLVVYFVVLTFLVYYLSVCITPLKGIFYAKKLTK